MGNMTPPTLTDRAERLRIDAARAGGLPLLMRASAYEETLHDALDLIRDMAKTLEGTRDVKAD